MQKTLLALTLTTSLLLFAPSQAHAKVQYSEGQVVVNKTEVVLDDLWIAGKTVRVEGKVVGDLYAAGENVLVTGEVTGDVILLAGTISIEGQVGQDAYLVGQDINLSGAKIADSLHLAGQSIMVSSDTTLGGSFLAAGETINSSAPVSRTLMAAGQAITLNAPVLGEVRLAGSSITLGPKMNIAKDLTYYLSPDNGKLDNQAVVKGQTNVVTEPASWQQKRQQQQQDQRNFLLMYHVWSYLGMLLVGAVLVWLAARPLKQAALTLASSPLRALGAGLLFTILTPPALILLSLTVIAIPLSLIALPLYVILLYVGKIVVALSLTRYVSSVFSISKLTPLMELFVGVTLLHLLKALPVGGFLVTLLATWIGVGAIYLSLKKSK